MLIERAVSNSSHPRAPLQRESQQPDVFISERSRTLTRKLFLFPVLLSAAIAAAQVAPSVTGSRSTLSAGALYSNFASDYTDHRLGGVTGFFDFNLTPRYGAEGEVRFLRFNEFSGEHETHYLIGPRVAFRTNRRLVPYAKFLLGVGRITFPENSGYGGFFAMAPGGGVDYKLTRRIKLRADYEYQIWPGAPNIPGTPSHGMTPNGVSAGVSYRIF